MENIERLHEHKLDKHGSVFEGNSMLEKAKRQHLEHVKPFENAITHKGKNIHTLEPHHLIKD